MFSGGALNSMSPAVPMCLAEKLSRMNPAGLMCLAEEL